MFGTNRNRPCNKRGPSLQQTGPVPGTNRPRSVEFHSKIGILSRLSLGRVGVRPWDICPARAVRKTFMCFVLIGFPPPKLRFHRYVSPPPYPASVIKSCTKFPACPLRNHFWRVQKMVSSGPCSRGFAFQYGLPPLFN